MQDFDPISPKDLPSIRTIEFEGNKMTIQRTDPFGFWYLHLNRGQLPAKLRGAYTSPDLATKDVLRYIDDKGKKLAAA
jgi:hypothetical protein